MSRRKRRTKKKEAFEKLEDAVLKTFEIFGSDAITVEQIARELKLLPSQIQPRVNNLLSRKKLTEASLGHYMTVAAWNDLYADKPHLIIR